MLIFLPDSFLPVVNKDDTSGKTSVVRAPSSDIEANALLARLDLVHHDRTLEAGVALVLHALEAMWGGEIFVPKIPSYKILDVAEAIAPRAEKRIVGIRPGEKLHEEMITETDALSTVEFDEHFVIMPATSLWNVDEFMAAGGGKRCKPGFRYSSDTNTDWLTVEQLRDLIRANVDPGFAPS